MGRFTREELETVERAFAIAYEILGQLEGFPAPRLSRLKDDLDEIVERWREDNPMPSGTPGDS